MIDDPEIDSHEGTEGDDASIVADETTALEASSAADAEQASESDATVEQSVIDAEALEPGEVRTDVADEDATADFDAASSDGVDPTHAVAPGRGYAIAAIMIAGVAAFAIGAALGKGFAPSDSDAAIARIDARDSSREQAQDDAYQSAYDDAFATAKKQGAAAGTRQGAIEGKKSGKAAAAKKAPAAAPASAAAVDCASFDLDGIDYGGGAGYFDISVRGMQCQEAKNLILAAGFGGNFTGLQANGWSCQSLGSEGETSQFRCSDSRDRVFRWWSGA